MLQLLLHIHHQKLITLYICHYPNKVVDMKAKQAQYYDSYIADCKAYWHTLKYVKYSSVKTILHDSTGSHIIGPIGHSLMQDVYNRKSLVLIGKIGNTSK